MCNTNRAGEGSKVSQMVTKVVRSGLLGSTDRS